MNTTLFISTPDGLFRARFSERGLAELTFPSATQAPEAAPAKEPKLPPPVRDWRRLTQTALRAALAGQPPRELPPLDLAAGTVFQQAVWKALAAIPRGQTQAYAHIADAIGRPKAARAVGQACGANPIPVLIPCHRAVAADGKWGGFSGGLEWKRRLLAREGVSLD